MQINIFDFFKVCLKTQLTLILFRADWATHLNTHLNVLPSWRLWYKQDYHKKIKWPDQGTDSLPIQIKGKIRYSGRRICVQ